MDLTTCFPQAAFSQDITLKLRQPSLEEVKMLRDEATLYSFLYPGQVQSGTCATVTRTCTKYKYTCTTSL